MFRNRQSSQRPPEEFIEKFKQTFPGVRTTSGSDSQSGAVAGIHGQDLNQPRNQFPDHEDLDPTPRAPGSEPFRFTPSLLDPTSSAFHAFADQPAGIYTPQQSVPGGGYGDVSNVLQTPNFGLSMDTPTGFSNAVSSMAPPPHGPAMGGYMTMPPPPMPHDYHHGGFGQFTPTIQPQYVEPGYGRMPSGPGSPMDTTDEPGLQMASYQQLHHGPQANQPDPYSAEKFRYHVTLHAPTAMVKSAEEIPVTYLNKGQAYALTIRDTKPPQVTDRLPRYRTYIRISFHDESQRQKPAACWQLWKEGRGTNEAHQRGGKLQAVEFVENAGTEQENKSKVELDSSSFDSFAVIWSPSPNSPAEGSVSVRFNFLSTDFSHSKGVKGIPVRLCAKTEMLPFEGASPQSSQDATASEICYCKVKLFRDHGAERKLANDILHIRKTIDKLRQQAAQAEGTGMKLFGKKKRDDDKPSKPGKAPKHKRTWSMSSASSAAGGKSVEDDTNSKLMALEAMFSSTRSVSVLFLRGSEEDDPDLHPVHLDGDQFSDDIWARRRSSVATTASSFVSPTPSSVSLAGSTHDLSSQDRSWSYQNMQGSDVPVRIRAQSETGRLTGWIEAIGIDPNYQPPAEKPIKAVMSVYVQPELPGTQSGNVYYRAVYLAERTVAALSQGIATKCGIEPSLVLRTTYVSPRGITILVDDAFVEQMNEGQDMKVQAIEVDEMSTLSPPQDWENQGGASVKQEKGRGWELRLLY